MRLFWAWPSELRAKGIFGINARNLGMLSQLNPREFYPRVDDKVITKEICKANDIPTPETYAVIRFFGDVGRLDEMLAPADGDRARESFVIKPARGAAGRGVLVIAGREGDALVTPSGRRVPPDEIRYHLATTLSGLYSLGGRPDRAIIEERILPHDVFSAISVGGTPDIRVVVHKGAPLMAMLRLPTNASGGRANLHQGAVGAGVDIKTGRTVGGVCRGAFVETHPDSGNPIGDLHVPFWDKVIDISTRLSKALELGYCGVDIVLDINRGPLVLEANARPGLAIQVANRCGIARRLPAEPE